MIVAPCVATQQVQLAPAWSVRLEDAQSVTFAELGDLDGDGFAELAAGYLRITLKLPPTTRAAGGHNAGDWQSDWDFRSFVLVLSGRTGDVLQRFEDTACGLDHSSNFGSPPVGFLPGSPAEPSGWLLFGQPAGAKSRGQVACLDLATGDLRYVIEGDVRGGRLGHAFALLDDLDDDGVAEFAVAAGGLNGVEGQHEGDAYVSVRSGATGAELRRLAPDVDSLWPKLFRADDLTGDGHAELGLVLQHWELVDGVGREQPRLLLIDVAHDAVLLDRVIEGSLPKRATCRATAVASIPDLDGDGLRELLLSESFPSIFADSSTDDAGGVIYALGGRTGDELLTWRSYDVSEGSGRGLAPIDDVNGDGVADVAITCSPGNAPRGCGQLRILDGESGDTLAELTGDATHVIDSDLVALHLAHGAVGIALSRSDPWTRDKTGSVEVTLVTVTPR